MRQETIADTITNCQSLLRPFVERSGIGSDEAHLNRCTAVLLLGGQVGGTGLANWLGSVAQDRSEEQSKPVFIQVSEFFQSILGLRQTRINAVAPPRGDAQ